MEHPQLYMTGYITYGLYHALLSLLLFWWLLPLCLLPLLSSSDYSYLMCIYIVYVYVCVCLFACLPACLDVCRSSYISYHIYIYADYTVIHIYIYDKISRYWWPVPTMAHPTPPSPRMTSMTPSASSQRPGSSELARRLEKLTTLGRSLEGRLGKPAPKIGYIG